MQLEPMDIYTRLLSAERSIGIDFTRHAVVCAAVAFHVAKPLQRRSLLGGYDLSAKH